TYQYQSFYPSQYSQQGGYQQQGGQDMNTALIEVRCPPDAELMVDGQKTQQTGPMRQFVTPSLKPGKTYTYELTMKRPGDATGQTREVNVQPGQRQMVDFTQQGPNPNQNPIRQTDTTNPLNPNKQ